jgi:inner membrane transporter RhtA
LKFVNSALAPVLFLITAIMAIQVGAALSKDLFLQVGAEGATALRFGISTIFLSVFFKPWTVKIDRGNWISLLVYGLSMCGACLFFYMSFRTIPLGIASTIEFSGPIAVAVFSSRRVVDFVYIGLAVIGLLLLMPFHSASASLDTWGVVYAILAAICWGIYIVSGKKAGAEHGLRTTSLGMIIASIVAVPVGIAHAGLGLFDVKILPLAIVISILTSAVPFTLEMLALQRISASAFGTLLSLEPAIASVVGFMILHEALSLLQCFAIALIVAASIGITLSSKKQQPQNPIVQ